MCHVFFFDPSLSRNPYSHSGLHAETGRCRTRTIGGISIQGTNSRCRHTGSPGTTNQPDRAPSNGTPNRVTGRQSHHRRRGIDGFRRIALLGCYLIEYNLMAATLNSTIDAGTATVARVNTLFTTRTHHCRCMQGTVVLDVCVSGVKGKERMTRRPVLNRNQIRTTECAW